MTGRYRLFGAELSPYSVKVRSYLRYRDLPFEWVVRNQENMEEFKRYAKLPLIPMLLTPDGDVLQDSTPIFEALDAIHPDPSIHPDDPVAAFVSILLEEFADEWVNKPMFHYRWFYEADQIATSERLAATNMGLTGDALAEAAKGIRERMTGRLHFVGSSEQNRPVIEGSLHRLLRQLETHLGSRPYLFGGRPSFGDFGLAAQLYECSVDPTAGAMMRAEAPLTAAYAERMISPSAEGPFETWADVKDTLRPILADNVAAIFLPWSAANAQALSAGEETMSVVLDGLPYEQATQKYHARSLGVLRRKYAEFGDKAAVDAALADTGCLQFLR